MGIFGGTPWRGMDSEDDMTEADWTARAQDQAMHMREGGSWETANIDEDGTPTAGCYNGDYTQEQQNAMNAKLDEDEYYEAEVEAQVNTLFKWW